MALSHAAAVVRPANAAWPRQGVARQAATRFRESGRTGAGTVVLPALAPLARVGQVALRGAQTIWCMSCQEGRPCQPAASSTRPAASAEQRPDLQRVPHGTWRRRQAGERAERARHRPRLPSKPPERYARRTASPVLPDEPAATRDGVPRRARGPRRRPLFFIFDRFPQQPEQASPDCIVVATRIAGREVWRKGPQEVVGTRRSAHGEEKPGALEVGQHSGSSCSGRASSSRGVWVGAAHVRWVPDRGAEGYASP